jgi:hypothetical protein
MKAVHLFFLIALGLVSLAVAQSTIGSFTFNKQIDPLNDQNRNTISTLELGNPKRAAQLQLRCDQNSQTKRVDLYVTLEHNLKFVNDYWAYSQVRWQYRFDGKPASAELLSYFSEDQSRIYLTDDTRADFVDQAKKSQRLVMVVTAEGFAPQTFSFRLEKFSEALAKLQCVVQVN